MVVYAPEYTAERLADAAQSLRALVARGIKSADTEAHVMRFEVRAPVSSADLPAWLSEQNASSKVYWRGRDGDYEVAGIGIADEVADDRGFALADVLGRLPLEFLGPHSHVRYFGGFRFDLSCSKTALWAPFGACRFVLPRIELQKREGRLYLACNVLPGRLDSREEAQDSVLAELDDVKWPPEYALPRAPDYVSRDDCPNEGAWREAVASVLAAINAGTFEKVVLARESRFHFGDALEPVDVFARLTASARTSYRFCFQPQEGTAFFGASPELLYRREGAVVETEAVAGTRPRGVSEEEDWQLGEELLASDKERREQGIVVEAIREAMEGLCADVQTDDRAGLMRLPNCQHLCSHIRGTLEGGASDAQILDALHPTPAVGGAPAASALTWLRNSEPFDRGWYAGPVGWIGRNAAEFAVGIRSGRVTGDTLALYSGAGIVLGSQAEKEWAEIENKMSGFMEALAGDTREDD